MLYSPPYFVSLVVCYCVSAASFALPSSREFRRLDRSSSSRIINHFRLSRIRFNLAIHDRIQIPSVVSDTCITRSNQLWHPTQPCFWTREPTESNSRHHPLRLRLQQQQMANKIPISPRATIRRHPSPRQALFPPHSIFSTPNVVRRREPASSRRDRRNECQVARIVIPGASCPDRHSLHRKLNLPWMWSLRRRCRMLVIWAMVITVFPSHFMEDC